MPLDDSWGTMFDAFPSFQTLVLHNAPVSGHLPPSWGTTFKHLTYLDLFNNSIDPTLPMGQSRLPDLH